MPVLKNMFSYPIKGFSGQRIEQAVLTQDRPFPGDRVFALTRPGSGINPESPVWAMKSKFVMLMMDASLAEISTHYDEVTGCVTVWRDGLQVLCEPLHTAQGCRAFEHYTQGLLKLAPDSPAPRLVKAQPAGPDHFMDKPDNVISIVNLETVRAFSQDVGMFIDPMRFRANLYIDGLAPWTEYNLMGETLSIGAVKFVIDRRNSRCAATNVNPKTAQRDIRLPSELRRLYGHTDLGIYVKVTEGGQIAVGSHFERP